MRSRKNERSVLFAGNRYGCNEVVFDQVLAVAGDDGKLNIGTPVVEGAKVTGVVKDLFRAKKIVVFKMKRRKSYRRTHGHRQDLNRIEITAIA